VETLAGILVATLGHKPQVVTTATDLLLQQGSSLGEVVAIHTAAAGELADSVSRLRAEFDSYPPYRSIPLRLQPIAGPAGALADVETAADAAAAFRAVYRVVLEAKRVAPQRTIHLSIVGGRKVFAVYGMAVAQLLFDDEDCLWYVLAGGRFLAEGRLHPGPGDEARLVRVPVLRWGTVSPILTDLSRFDDPFQAADHQREKKIRERMEEARAYVLGSLSGAERPAVELLALEGLTDEQIAERLSLSARTVSHHLASAYAKARAHWGLPEVGRHQLIALLQMFFVWKGD
jgi:CRISPR-associated protein Csx14